MPDPTRTSVAPSWMARSKSELIPIDSRVNPLRAAAQAQAAPAPAAKSTGSALGIGLALVVLVVIAGAAAAFLL